MGRAGRGGGRGPWGVRISALLPGEAAFLRHVFALPAAAREAGLPILAAFREASARAALGVGAKALARLEPLGAASCVRRRRQREHQCGCAGEPGAPEQKFFAILPPSRTPANAKRVGAYFQSETGLSPWKASKREHNCPWPVNCFASNTCLDVGNHVRSFSVIGVAISCQRERRHASVLFGVLGSPTCESSSF